MICCDESGIPNVAFVKGLPVFRGLQFWICSVTWCHKEVTFIWNVGTYLFRRHLLTYLLTPWSRVLLEQLTSKVCSYSRNSPHLWNPKVPHRTHKCPPSVPVLSQLHPVPTTPSNFLKIHFNIILPSTYWPPQWPLSLRLPHQHSVQSSILPHTRHLPCNGEKYTEGNLLSKFPKRAS